jgi:hypothetical protein
MGSETKECQDMLMAQWSEGAQEREGGQGTVTASWAVTVVCFARDHQGSGRSGSGRSSLPVALLWSTQ